MADDLDTLIDEQIAHKGPPPATTGDDLDALIDEHISGKAATKLSGGRSVLGNLWEGTKGASEILASGATGAVAAVPASVAYAGSAIGESLGLDVNPSEVMHKVQDYLTYHPTSEGAQGAGQIVKDVAAPIVRPVTSALDTAATRVGEVSPMAEQAMREAPNAFNASLGIMGLSPLAAPAAAAVREVPAAARAVASGAVKAGEKLAAGREALSDAATRAVGGTPRASVRLDVAPSEPTFGADTLSSAAAAPSMAGVSRELQTATRNAARETGGAIEREVWDRQAQADRLGLPPLTEGQATQDPTVISHERNGRLADPRFIDRFNVQNRAMVDKLDEYRQELSPNTVHNDPVQNGQILVDEYKAHDAPVKKVVDDAYEKARAANGGDLPMDAKGFITKLDQVKNSKSKFLPSDVAAELTQFRDGAAMSFDQFEDLRTTLANAARKANAASDGNAAHAIGVVRKTLEGIEVTGTTKEVKSLYDNARSLAKQRFDRMETDPAYAAALDDDVPMGNPSTLADKFIDRYVSRATKEHVRRMGETLQGSDMAREVMAGAALDDVRQKAISSGNFGQKGYNSALTRLGPKLDQLVGGQMHEQLRDLGEYAHNVMNLPAGHAVSTSNTATALIGEQTKAVAKAAAEHGANAMAGGIPVGTVTRKIGGYIADRRGEAAARKAADRALAPGAGLTRLREVLKAPKR